MTFQQFSGECVYMVKSKQWLQSMMSAAQSGIGPSYIRFGCDGNADLILFGILIESANQGDSRYWQPCRTFSDGGARGLL